MKRLAASVVSLAFAAIAAAQEGTPPAKAAKAKTPSLPDGVKVARDLHLPSAPAASPPRVVIWVHGGGWNAGIKDRCPGVWLVPEGFAPF